MTRSSIEMVGVVQAGFGTQEQIALLVLLDVAVRRHTVAVRGDGKPEALRETGLMWGRPGNYLRLPERFSAGATRR